MKIKTVHLKGKVKRVCGGGQWQRRCDGPGIETVLNTDGKISELFWIVLNDTDGQKQS